MFTLAMIQMRVDGGAKEENLARAEASIAQAANGGADVVLLPEALNLGWTHSSARTDADEIPDGRACGRMRAAAAGTGVSLLRQPVAMARTAARVANPLPAGARRLPRLRGAHRAGQALRGLCAAAPSPKQ